MATKLNEYNVILLNGTTSTLRKQLLAEARNGGRYVRLVGGKKTGWYTAVLCGENTLRICSPSFTTRKRAERWNERKTEQVLPVRAVAMPEQINQAEAA